MRLSEILRPLGGEPVSIEPPGDDPEITGLEYDSRRVTPGTLFFAVTGYSQDGRRFIPQALERGARAVVSQHPEWTGSATLVGVGNVRRAMALMSAAFHGYPAGRMATVAITGTAGKTTTSYLLRSILASAGMKTGLVGTIRYLIGEQAFEAPNTTPESLDLQRLLARMCDDGVQAAVMEASSHGIELDRVAGIGFKAAVFTNFSQDHLDFHGNMEEYFRAKKKLFENLEGSARAVINVDDAMGLEIQEATKAQVWTYGLGKAAGIRAEITNSDISGTGFLLSASGGRIAIDLKLPGIHNVYNALAAAGASMALGIRLEQVKRGLESVASVDGRMERVDLGQNFTVLVDYAHTPEELERLMLAVKALGPRRLITVFGCGGDRDKTKRALMGRAVAGHADLAIVTSDNPRTEDPQAIIGDILPGMAGSEHAVIADRRQAIRKAVELAGEGDAVVIAGKGHEDYQIVGTNKIHFDDREEAREALKLRTRA
jgi:UDP-N-acetylmuramoyl-L-alanyl-D-glutamate--2,6-diaminopimelate ligase